MKKYTNKEKYTADCSKCSMLHTGSQYYFQKDLKEKCFCGAELINFRIYGTTFDADAYAVAQKMIDDALANSRVKTQKIIADEIAKSILANASKWHSDLVSGKIPLD